GSTTNSLSLVVNQTWRVWVRITGQCGTRDSNAAWMSMTPTVYGPGDQTVASGSAIGLRVSASSTYLSYQWINSNGTPISGATSPFLLLPNVTSPPNLACQVTSGAATVTSRWPNINICYNGPTVSVNWTANGPSCRFINANISGDYSDIEWYQG